MSASRTIAVQARYNDESKEITFQEQDFCSVASLETTLKKTFGIPDSSFVMIETLLSLEGIKFLTSHTTGYASPPSSSSSASPFSSSSSSSSPPASPFSSSSSSSPLSSLSSSPSSSSSPLTSPSTSPTSPSSSSSSLPMLPLSDNNSPTSPDAVLVVQTGPLVKFPVNSKQAVLKLRKWSINNSGNSSANGNNNNNGSRGSPHHGEAPIVLLLSVCISPLNRLPPAPIAGVSIIDVIPASLVFHPIVKEVLPIFLQHKELIALLQKQLGVLMSRFFAQNPAGASPLDQQEASTPDVTHPRVGQQEIAGAQQTLGQSPSPLKQAPPSEATSFGLTESNIRKILEILDQVQKNPLSTMPPETDEPEFSSFITTLYRVVQQKEQDLVAGADRLSLAFQTCQELGFPVSDRGVLLILYYKYDEDLSKVIKALIQRIKDSKKSSASPTRSIQASVASVETTTIRCQSCDKTIGNDQIRYKCGHCPNFDLCSACEASNLHNPTHIFLKIRPVAQLTQGELPTEFPMLSNRVRTNVKKVVDLAHRQKRVAHSCQTQTPQVCQ